MTSARDDTGIAGVTVRQLATLATNVAVVTALLVYFGWRRTETQAARLGIDETILGLSTRDYLLRSVGPVLQLLAVVAVVGLLSVQAERALRPLLRRGRDDRLVRVVVVGLSWCWLLLPLVVVALGYALPAVAFVAFPLAIAVGLLLLVYASGLRHRLAGRELEPPGSRRLERAAVAVALAVALFWATSNYAEVSGNQVADQVISDVRALTAVTVYSHERLAIEAPGTQETTVVGTGQLYRYRYTGLRLLEHAGGRYFLLSDDWTPASGRVVVLSDSGPLRYEFGTNAAP